MIIKDDEIRDILEVEGVNARGYGITPKLVMQDTRLTIEAKAIYAYFCTYAGAGTTAFPGRDKIVRDLGIGVHRYSSHLKLLKEYGYLKSRQETSNGKFGRKIFTLVQNPVEDQSLKSKDKNDEKSPCVDFDHTVKNQVKSALSPCDDFTHTDDTHTDEPHTDNSHTKSNNIKINSINSLVLSSHIESPKEQKDDVTGQDKIKKLDNQKTRAAIEQEIKEQISYDDDLVYDEETNSKRTEPSYEQIDRLVNLMVEIKRLKKPQIFINGGYLPTEDVLRQFDKIESKHIQHVLMKWSQNHTKIKKLKPYLVTMLYNSVDEVDAYWENQVTFDMYNQVTQAKTNRNNSRHEELDRLSLELIRQNADSA